MCTSIYFERVFGQRRAEGGTIPTWYIHPDRVQIVWIKLGSNVPPVCFKRLLISDYTYKHAAELKETHQMFSPRNQGIRGSCSPEQRFQSLRATMGIAHGDSFLFRMSSDSSYHQNQTLYLLTSFLGLVKATPNMRSIQFNHRIPSVGSRSWNRKKVSSLFWTFSSSPIFDTSLHWRNLPI